MTEALTYVPAVTVFDGERVRTRAGVLVDGGVIRWVGAHARAPREARSAQPLEAGGGLLTPGLIDCHVHLCFDGARDWVTEAAVSDAYAAVRCVLNAQRHLAAGVTTVRDLGGLGAVVCEVAKAIQDGRAPGPLVVASGQALTISGGHGWNSFARQVDGPDAVRRAVREQLRSGARSIKLVATGGVLTPGIAVDFTAFSQEELGAAVEEAHNWGVPLAAHAIGAAGIERAVRAGVDSIEHGSEITRRIARLMKERGTVHVPTISALRGILERPEDVPAYAVEKAARIADAAREAFATARNAGVVHACGTDAGTPHNPHGAAPRELISMVEWGMSSIQALQAATTNAARLLGLASIGRVDPGRAADLVLWDGNPAEDISAVLRPSLVMKGGRRVA